MRGSSRWHLACHLMLVLHFPDVAILILTGAMKPRLIIVEPFVFLLWAQSTFPTTPFAHWQSHPSLCPLAHNTTFIARVSTSYPSHIIHKSSSSYSNSCHHYWKFFGVQLDHWYTKYIFVKCLGTYFRSFISKLPRKKS